MQLTDAEIRQILIQEKRRKLRRRRKRRRISILVVILLIVALILIIKFHPDSSNAAEESQAETPPRGIIFIDPGHGGEDPGSDNGARYEKDDTLRLANEVRSYLEDAGFKVYMSRTTDDNIDRTRRGEMANECGAQLMLCIHRNKASGGGDGVEAFIPLSDTAESRLLAENILQALVGEGFTERSVRAGTLQSTEENYNELEAATMPACLVEVGFISNEKDNKLFDENLDGNARAVAGAIESTFHTLYEPEETTEDTETGGAEEDGGEAVTDN